jgi:putative restriction endonuclease
MSAEWAGIAAKLTVWKRGGQAAPHKPLLLLLILAQAQRRGPNEFPFAEINDPMQGLLREFGPSRKSYHPEYPFQYLQSDGVWTLDGTEGLQPRKEKNQLPKGELLRANVSGRVPEHLWKQLVDGPKLIARTAEELLDEFWPSALHEAILDAVGLSFSVVTHRRRRDTDFRPNVLRAYEGRCAICGYDGQLQGLTFGLDASHIKWHAYDGPDEVTNGLALCSLHHIAFDRGAISLDSDQRILISQDLAGDSSLVREALVAYNGQAIRPPQSKTYLPSSEYLYWHRDNVFKAPQRDF